MSVSDDEAMAVVPGGKDYLAKSYIYGTAQEAWRAAVVDLLENGVPVHGVKDQFSVGSAFGERERGTRELVSVAFALTSPRHRLIRSVHRRVDLGYAIANAIWTFSGSDDAESISFYNPGGQIFSDDGARLFAAPGKRIFNSPAGDQFDRAIQRLKEDATTRRAVISLFNPADLCAGTRDCSCAVSLQFLLRAGALSCITYMRSQSALMVLPYDLFLFTLIHEAVALNVGVPPGPYHHFCGSLHYYEDEEDLVQAVAAAPEPPAQEMPAMQAMSAELRLQLAAAERAVRRQLSERPHTPIDPHPFELDAYWTDLLRAMIVGVRQRRGLPQPEEELAGLSPIYRRVLVERQARG